MFKPALPSFVTHHPVPERVSPPVLTTRLSHQVEPSLVGLAPERRALAFGRALLRLERTESLGWCTNGRREASFFSLHLARTAHPSGIVYVSEEAHPSLFEAARSVGLTTLKVRTRRSGEIDYKHLAGALSGLRDYPAIVTVQLESDDTERIVRLLASRKIRRFHLHGESSLERVPRLVEQQRKLDTIALCPPLAGRPGAPSLVFARPSLAELLNAEEPDAEAVGSGFSVTLPECVTTSRRNGKFIDLVRSCEKLTKHALRRFFEIGWPAWVSPHSNRLLILRPALSTVRKWRLEAFGDLAELVLVPGSGWELIEGLVHDLGDSRCAPLE